MKSHGVIVVILVGVLALLMGSGVTTFASQRGGAPGGLTRPLVRADVEAAPTPTWTPAVSAPEAPCVDDAAYVVDVTVPDNSRLATGEVFTKTWRVKNTGTCAWNEGYKLVYERGQQMGGPAEAAISAVVPAGNTTEVSVPLRAPDVAGVYSGVWRLANDRGVRFGHILTVVVAVGGGVNPGRAAVGAAFQPRQFDPLQPLVVRQNPIPTLVELDTDFINDSIAINIQVPTPTPTATPETPTTPPPEPVKAGGRFKKTWVMRNSGFMDWGSGYLWSFVGGDQMGAPDAVEVPPTAAGGRFEVEVPMIAPARSGIYEGVWQMRDPSGRLFGKQGLVRVKVNEVQMNEPVQLGNWIIRVIRCERDTTVWLDKERYEAEGVFALIRMLVTYLGEGTGWMVNDLDFSAHDEDGYSFSYNEDVGDAARWMIANQAAIDFGFPPGTTDYPVLIAFPVPAESKELWLDVSLKDEALNWLRKKDPNLRIEDVTQQASFYLRATLSKREMTYTGTFIDCNEMDE